MGGSTAANRDGRLEEEWEEVRAANRDGRLEKEWEEVRQRIGMEDWRKSGRKYGSE